jgi:hypothetical protein
LNISDFIPHSLEHALPTIVAARADLTPTLTPTHMNISLRLQRAC